MKLCVCVFVCVCVCAVDDARVAFMIDEINTHHGIPRPMRRGNIYLDVLETYEENLNDVLEEFPFRIRYENERAQDTGGVCRDMFSSFWEEAYVQHFDGEKLLIPSMRPGVNMAKFKLIGTILVHGFMVCGFLPVRIAFPVIAAVLLGPDVKIPDTILIESFVDFLSSHDGSLLHDAVVESKTNQSLSSDVETKNYWSVEPVWPHRNAKF